MVRPASIASGHDLGKLLTPRVASERLGVNIETIRRWIRKGAVQVVLVGPHRRQRISEAEVVRQINLEAPGPR